VVYAGDDRTDEDVFEALAAPAITVKVGPHVHPTAARYRLDSIEDVYRCIGLLETWLGAPAPLPWDDRVERRAAADGGSHPAPRIVAIR
jgi:trehalose-6-phosphatase